MDSISRFMASDKAFCTWLAVVNGFNPWFRAARSSGVIGTFTPEAIDDCIAWAGVLDVETGAVGVGALAGVTVVVLD